MGAGGAGAAGGAMLGEGVGGGGSGGRGWGAGPLGAWCQAQVLRWGWGESVGGVGCRWALAGGV